VRILCSTGAVTRHPTRADHRLIADVRGLPCDGFELSIYPVGSTTTPSRRGSPHSACRSKPRTRRRQWVRG
jgi:hypothetical protein